MRSQIREKEPPVVYEHPFDHSSGRPVLLLRLLPAAWASLVVSAGPALAGALAAWDPAPRTAGGLLLWGAWAAVLLATLVPRPLSLTAVRSGSALALLVGAAALPAAGAGKGIAAVAATAVAAACAFAPTVGEHFVNGLAYGDERRFPLRVPPALLLGPLPLALLAVGAGVATGPLLLAGGRPLGVIALAAGLPLSGAAFRSLYGLSQRWAVLVPAGIVLKDPLTLVDPVLFPRDRIVALRPLAGPALPPGTLDLRLGAARGALHMELTEDATLFRARGRKRGGDAVVTRSLAFTPRRADVLLADAARRRIPAG
jgi:hypothetical protein